MHEFELIEDSTLTALSPLKAMGVKTLGPYAGELDESRSGAENLMNLAWRFPCLYVAAGGLSSSTANKTETIESSVVLIVGAKNIRGGVQAARGDGGSPGVYSILEQAKALLHRQRIVPGFLPLTLQREYPVLYQPAQGVCVFMAVYATRCVK
jgi:hypothetical protein